MSYGFNPFTGNFDLTKASGGTIGAPVINGTPPSVLYIDPSGNLGQDPGNFDYVQADKVLRLGALTPTTTQLLIGTTLTSLDVLGSAYSPKLLINTSEGSPTTGLAFFGLQCSDDNTNVAFGGFKSRGTVSAQTIIQAGDQAAAMYGLAYDGATYALLGQVMILVDPDASVGADDITGWVGLGVAQSSGFSKTLLRLRGVDQTIRINCSTMFGDGGGFFNDPGAPFENYASATGDFNTSTVRGIHIDNALVANEYAACILEGNGGSFLMLADTSNNDDQKIIALHSESALTYFRIVNNDLTYTNREFFRFDHTNGNVTFNNFTLDQDFIVHGSGNSNVIYADASVARVGFGTASPTDIIHIYSGGTSRLRVQTTAGAGNICQIAFERSTQSAFCGLAATDTFDIYSGTIPGGGGNCPIVFYMGTSETARIANTVGLQLATGIPISLGSTGAGCRITASAGAMALKGFGQTNNEDLIFDFETTANKVYIGSSTGVTSIEFTGIGLSCTTLTASSLTAGRIPYVGTSGLLVDTNNFQWINSTSTLNIFGAETITYTNTQAFLVEQSGGANVFLVNTTTPGAVVSGTLDVSGIATFTGSSVSFSSGGETLTITPNSPANHVTLSTDPTSNFTIDSGGDINLDMYPSAAGLAAVIFKAGGYTVASLNDLGVFTCPKIIVTASSETLTITPNNPSNYVTFDTSGTSHMRFDSGGNFVFDMASTGDYISWTANDVEQARLTGSGGLLLYSTEGVDCNPGSDADTDCLTIGVTGAPRIWWDESQDNFVTTKDLEVPDEAYGSGWNGVTEVPTKNAVYDKIEALHGGYIKINANSWSPTDAATEYAGITTGAPTTTEGIRKIYFRKAGTIKVAEIYAYATGTAGSNEAWSCYVRLNATTDTLIATLSLSTAERIFTNSALSISVAAGDYIEIKFVNPTWATNPTAVFIGGYVYVE